jgi:hypothetical protein
VTEEVVGAKGVDVHVLARRDELGSRKIVEGEVVLEERGDLHDVLGAWRLAGGADLGATARFPKRTGCTAAHLAEELLVGSAVAHLLGGRQGRFTDRGLQELGRLESDLEQLALALFLCATGPRLRHPPEMSPRTISKSLAKVDGSMPGKRRRKMGKAASAKGTMRKTEKGMLRKRSLAVRLSWRSSRRVRLLPRVSLRKRRYEILISLPRSLVPCQ